MSKNNTNTLERHESASGKPQDSAESFTTASRASSYYGHTVTPATFAEAHAQFVKTTLNRNYHTSKSYDAERADLIYKQRIAMQSKPRRLSFSSPRQQKILDTADGENSNTSSNQIMRSSSEESSTQLINVVAHRRKRAPNRLNRENNLFLEMLRLQRSTKNLIPKMPFMRLVREIIKGNSTEVDRITGAALEALQEATELYTTQQLQDAYLLALHTGRVTLFHTDLHLLQALRQNCS